MRYPIQRQLLWPMLQVVLLGSTVTALLAAWLGLRAVQRSERERLQQIAGTLTDAGFPLTDAVLKRMSDLSGARFVTLDHAGAVLHASQEISAHDQEQIARLPLNSKRDESYGDQPVTLSPGDFRAVRIAVRSTAAPTSSLVILTSQEHWNDLAWRAALPPLIAGLLSSTIAGLIAVVLSRRFVRRIHALADRAAVLADGQFDRQPLPVVDDELRDLAVALNTAAEKLDRYETQVRQGERLQTLGRLGAGMAHQLRNAITGARMALDLHTAELPAATDRESLAVAVRQLALMEAYLQRFLTLGRGETPVPRDVNLPALVSDTLQLVEPMCQHHGIGVTWQPPAEPMSIPADAASLRQLMLNLLINAIEAVQALPAAQRKIGVDVTSGNEGVQLSIWDHGAGPSADIAKQLFEPFVTDKPDGTGLGLAVALEIAQAQGGGIQWRRESGRTCFEVTLSDKTAKPQASGEVSFGVDDDCARVGYDSGAH